VDGGGLWSPASDGLPPGIEILVVDPVTPSTLYAGSAAGVFRSTDRADHWSPARGELAATFVNGLAIDARARRTVLAASADGVFKSTDGGERWSLMSTGMFGLFVDAVAIEPGSTTTYYAATSGGVFQSLNGGALWAAASVGLPPGPVGTVAVDPVTRTTLYAGVFGVGVFKSVNAGGSWSPVNVGLTDVDILTLAIDPRTPTTLYVGTFSAVFKSVNGGASWNPTGLGPNDLIRSIAIDPVNPAIVYAASDDDGVYRSVNGGTSWTSINTGLGSLEVRGLAIDPLAPATLYAGTRSGVYKSTDGGATWSNINRGLTEFEINTLAVNPAAPTTVFAGTNGGGVFQRRQLAAPLVTGTGPSGGPNVKTFTMTGAPGPASFLAYDAGFTGGVYVAAGDLDGNGGMHIVTGTGPGGGAHVRAFEANGAPRATSFLVYPPGFTGGVRVAACDFDGDGRAEIVTGAGPTGGPHVRVIKLGASGQPQADLASFLAFDAGFTGGLFVACGDVDGDAHPEIIVGVDAGGGPEVRVFRYAPGAAGGVTPFLQFFAYDPAFRGGIRVAAGDLDDSRRASIVLGAGPGGGPHVRVLAWTGSALVERASFFVYDPGFRNGIFVAVGNVTAESAAQIVTGADAGGGPHVRVLTGTGADTGIGFFAYDAGFRGGVRVGAVQ
jgi:photosystem II stability/assembly factor-like uncharacterized protein